MQQHFSPLQNKALGVTQHLTAGGPMFKFEPLRSVSPIRFQTETSNQLPTTNLGSQSSLSSNMTPEATTLATKHVLRPGGDMPAKNDLRSNSSYSPSTSKTPSLIASINEMHQQALAGLHAEQESMIEVSQTPPAGSAPYQASSEGRKPTGKLTTQYVMPDGSVITGRGLGRGRPGVKRGPRRSKPPGEDSTESTPTAPLHASKSSVTAIGGKRKRSDSETSNIRARSVSSSLHSRDSSVEYNPTLTQTRSGRQTQKPIPLTVPAATPSITASPASKKVSTPITSTPALKTHPKIKRKIYRGKEAFALCEHCLRGFGPVGNVIVFCDACNKCWHQRCHQPQIPKEIVADSKAEWFCATCDKILHGNKKSKRPVPIKPEATTTLAPPPEQKFGPPLVGAIALTLEQRKKYLQTLSREQLINLALRAGELAPQMPVFETPIPLPRVGPPLQPQFTSDYITPVTATPGFDKTESNEVPDEGYDDSYDEHAALYPKTGEGVTLPPEREDLNMLLEGPDSRTFSHWVKGLPVKTVVDTVPLHLSQPKPPPLPQAQAQLVK